MQGPLERTTPGARRRLTSLPNIARNGVHEERTQERRSPGRSLIYGDSRCGCVCAALLGKYSRRGAEVSQAGLRISVVVPAYNATKTIEAALRSALEQELAPLEVIVVDDGSQDGTAEFVEREFPTVRMVRQQNAGPSAARNTAGKLAQGDWLAFLDADDTWLPQKLRLQAAALEAAPEIGMCSTSWVRDRSQAPAQFSAEAMPTRRFRWHDILRLNRFQTSTALVRKDLFERVGGFRPEIDGTEDWDFWMRVAQHTDDLHLEIPLVVYTDEQGSYSKNSRRVYDAMHRMLKTLGPPDGPVSAEEMHRLVAWHDVRFSYAFWRLHRSEDLRYALRHGRTQASGWLMLQAALFEFIPYILGRGARKVSR